MLDSIVEFKYLNRFRKPILGRSQIDICSELAFVGDLILLLWVQWKSIVVTGPNLS